MQHRHGFAAIVMGTMTLSACTLEPEYVRPNAPVTTPEPNVVPGIPAEDLGWRAFFPDPQLQQLIVLAPANNRDLRVAALNVETAQARYRIQRADLFPTIAASTTEQSERIPASVLAASLPAGGASGQDGVVPRSYTAGIGFTSFELDLFGRIRSLSHAALQEYFSFEETRRSAQITLVAEVANAYLNVLADQTLIDITRQTLQNQSDSYALTQTMFEVGATTQLALRQAESTVDTAKANLARYERQFAVDRDALQLVLGAPIPTNIDFSTLAARSTLDEQWATQQALVTASKDAYRLADMRFHGGVDGYLSALDAQRSLYGAQQQLQLVRLLRLENRVTFYKALGGGLQENTATASTVPRAG